MKKLEFKIDIAADAKKVWNTMLSRETYKEWIKGAWPGSTYEGEWKKGENMKFVSNGQGGTMVTITESKPFEFIEAEHVAVINKDGSLDKYSAVAKGWIGTTESYRFTESKGKTELLIEIHTTPEWASMFSEGWPIALDNLKKICEN